MGSPDAVEHLSAHIKSALAHLYDPGYLYTSPLVGMLPPGERGAGAAALLRQWLRDAIEALRPDSSVPYYRAEWMGYRILSLTYLQSLSAVAVCQELDISVSTYYRRHQEAIDAVAVILEQRAAQEAAGPEQAPETRGLAPAANACSEAVKLAQASPQRPVDLVALVESTRHLLLYAAEEKGVSLEIEASPRLPAIYGDPAMLRQAILNLLLEAVRLASPSGLCIRISSGDGEARWCVQGIALPPAQPGALQNTPGYTLGQALLGVYGGRLWVEQAEPGERPLSLCFALPVCNPPAVLIIDDDSDTLQLYRRYLQDHAFIAETAQSVEEAHARLAESHYALILMDMLMPDQDGWDLLTFLRSTPETAAIPVIVCSVLSQPDLVLALGAAEVLLKPVDEETLLASIRRVITGAGNAESPPPPGR